MTFRYPGPNSFQDDMTSEKTFFGRKQEVNELGDRIISEHLTVLYGKSGIGKTSLLNAGLFPRLRSHGFAPFIVRLKTADGKWLESIVEAFEKMVKTQGYQFSRPESNGYETIGNYFSSILLSQGDQFLKPVLVLDQFEEVFQMNTADLTSLNQNIFKVLGRGSIYRKQDNIRIVFSLREEYVGALDEFSDAIPALLQNRFRLKPLDIKGTLEAIREPALLEGEIFNSPTFEYHSDLIDKLIKFLSVKNEFEPIQLQIICSFIEQQVASRAAKNLPYSPISLESYFDNEGINFQHVLEQFYLNTVDKLESDVNRSRVRDLCEFGLVQANGFRNSMASKSIKRDYGVDEATLFFLVNARLLRSEDRLNDLWYEITHDRIAEAISAKKRFKLPKVLWSILSVLVLAVFFAAYAFVIEREQAFRLEQETIKVKEQLEQISQINQDLESKNDELRTMQNRLQNSLKNINPAQNVAFTIPVMVNIPAGSFLMGDERSEPTSFALPTHQQKVDAFRLSKFEVTYSQFDIFVEQTGRERPYEESVRLSNRPVSGVSWQDAVAYTEWLNEIAAESVSSFGLFRLPTEEEWEYAAKSGSEFSGAIAPSLLCEFANHADKTMNAEWGNNACSDGVGQKASIVGTYKQNLFGIHDMLGNVSEWVLDCWSDNYQNYIKPNSRTVVPLNCERKVIKGGSWIDTPEAVYAGARGWAFSNSRSDRVGFRIVQIPHTISND